MKHVKESTTTELFNSTSGLDEHSLVFNKTGLNPFAKYRVCAEFTYNYNIDGTLFYANLNVNGTEIESNITIPSKQSAVMPSQIVGYVNPDVNGNIELVGLFGKMPTQNPTPPVRIYRISYTIEEVNYN